MVLNLFYEEPEGDRWLPFDRYPRRVVRRLVRGPRKIGGQERVFLNLCAGLRKIGVPFRCNDYSYAQQHPRELACIVGKPFVLDKIRWKNPLLFGASVFSHPLADPDLLGRMPAIRRILVPGEWMRRMWEPYYGDRVTAWAVGIDTEHWVPRAQEKKEADILIYDKVRWHHDQFETTLLTPAREILASRGLKVREIRYGSYAEEDFRRLLGQCRAMLFLCEHETQGIAYQQALAAGVPILAWNRGGDWQDPQFFPDRVKYGPVSSVPYWDMRCGLTFASIAELPQRLDQFLSQLQSRSFAPRDFILENLTLERCAAAYLRICEEVIGAR
jgi:hypothetical protein